ncbi:MAG TPA: 50S ribosomal protein L17 [Candidatus Saccharimonadales bacterium]|nr:50S ribosomal protein L17 [Candidatus Saccharimonadales bacterium]
MLRNTRAQADYKTVLLRNQLTSLVLFESITTTAAKARVLVTYANRFYSRVKDADLTAKRYAHETLLDKNAVKKMFEEILPRYKSGETTFVRTFRLLPRKGDSAEMMMVSLIRPLVIEEKTVAEPKKGKK